MSGASGKFNRFFSKSLSCITSIRLRLVISLAILSTFGLTGLSAPSGTGIVKGSIGLDVAAGAGSV